MSPESLPSPSLIERAATGLEQALARIVAHVRAEFASERRAMEADIRAANAELATIRERVARAHDEFELWFKKMQERRIEMSGAPGEPGEDGKPGKDGAIGNDGPMGPTGPTGPQGDRGKDGEPGAIGIAGERGGEGPQGRDGRDGLPGLPGVQGERGKDGRDAIDGKDGIGFDATRQFEEGESFGIEFLRGDEVIRKFTWKRPTFADYHCGPYNRGEAYKRGQCATYGGSTFMCLRDTNQKPETDDWRLIVKHGLPGRSGSDGERGAPGPAGRDGRDLTQLSSGGLKHG